MNDICEIRNDTCDIFSHIRGHIRSHINAHIQNHIGTYQNNINIHAGTAKLQ